MAKRRDDGKWAFFDVHYTDGSRTSNRKVPTDLLGGLDGDGPAGRLAGIVSANHAAR